MSRTATPDPVARLADALTEIAEVEVALERPADAEHGDYATNVALKLAGLQKRPPREIADEIAEQAVERGLAERAEAAGPGFVNLWLAEAWLADGVGEIAAAAARFGAGSAEPAQRYQVEMVSANPTGPITVAHARNGAYGDSVARLLEFAGHDVEREYYGNDGGSQMELFHASVDALRRGEAPPEDGYHGAYMHELAALPGDPVPHMLASMKESLERFRVRFDTWTWETELEPEIPAAIELLDTYRRTVRCGHGRARTATKGPRPHPLGRRADLLREGRRLCPSQVRGRARPLVYVLGADHHGYVRRLQALAAMLGHDPEAVEVLIYQLVQVVEGGAARKMSKRRGDVVSLDELLDAIGVDAARWYLVSRGHDQAMELDIDLAAERSQKNPVYYVQYAHARIAGILRNAAVSDTSV